MQISKRIDQAIESTLNAANAGAPKFVNAGLTAVVGSATAGVIGYGTFKAGEQTYHLGAQWLGAEKAGQVMQYADSALGKLGQALVVGGAGAGTAVGAFLTAKAAAKTAESVWSQIKVA